MSMGVVLQTIRDHLRTAMSLAVDQCGIRPGGHPPSSAGEFYVAIDDISVKGDARAHLREEYEVAVSIWRRLGQHPEDRTGDVLETEDPYLPSLLTLDQLERDVIRFIHANYTEVTKTANATLGTGTPGKGDILQLAMYYQGHAGSERFTSEPRNTSRPDWIGRRLRFAGMTRVQATDIAH